VSASSPSHHPANPAGRKTRSVSRLQYLNQNLAPCLDINNSLPVAGRLPHSAGGQNFALGGKAQRPPRAGHPTRRGLWPVVRKASVYFSLERFTARNSDSARDFSSSEDASRTRASASAWSTSTAHTALSARTVIFSVDTDRNPPCTAATSFSPSVVRMITTPFSTSWPSSGS